MEPGQIVWIPYSYRFFMTAEVTFVGMLKKDGKNYYEVKHESGSTDYSEHCFETSNAAHDHIREVSDKYYKQFDKAK